MMIASKARTTLADPDTRAMLRDALDASGNRQAVALMLKMAGCPEVQSRYLAGPIVLMASNQTEAAPSSRSRLPGWLVRAIAIDRLETILAEVELGRIGTRATPTEVLAYLHPTTPDAPWWSPDEWARIYLWTRHNVLTRYDGQLSWELVDARGEPVQLSAITLTEREQHSFRDLARHIRQTVVDNAVSRDIPPIYRHQERPVFFNIGESFESLFRECWPAEEVPHAAIR